MQVLTFAREDGRASNVRWMERNGHNRGLHVVLLGRGGGENGVSFRWARTKLVEAQP